MKEKVQNTVHIQQVTSGKQSHEMEDNYSFVPLSGTS